MKYVCGNCEEPIKKGQQFCDSCGEEASWDDDAPPSTLDSVEETDENNNAPLPLSEKMTLKKLDNLHIFLAWDIVQDVSYLVATGDYYSKSELRHPSKERSFEKLSFKTIRSALLIVGEEAVNDSTDFFKRRERGFIERAGGLSEFLYACARVYDSLEERFVDNEDLAELLNRGSELHDEFIELRKKEKPKSKNKRSGSTKDVDAANKEYRASKVAFTSSLSNFDKSAFEKYDRWCGTDNLGKYSPEYSDGANICRSDEFYQLLEEMSNKGNREPITFATGCIRLAVSLFYGIVIGIPVSIPVGIIVGIIAAIAGFGEIELTLVLLIVIGVVMFLNTAWGWSSEVQKSSYKSFTSFEALYYGSINFAVYAALGAALGGLVWFVFTFIFSLVSPDMTSDTMIKSAILFCGIGGFLSAAKNWGIDISGLIIRT
ncbi:MAG: hypothetical protein LBB42_05450 [Coriobacteriales bacterium]|jgi:type III secretory pathway component EscS|nr:hypothetical protein [Coriobacteriales bacterium]